MQNPLKRWEIFTSKKGCEGVYEFSRIFRWSCWKNDGGGVEVPVESLKEWRECSTENEKEEKERKEKRGSESAKGMKR